MVLRLCIELLLLSEAMIASSCDVVEELDAMIAVLHTLSLVQVVVRKYHSILNAPTNQVPEWWSEVRLPVLVLVGRKENDGLSRKQSIIGDCGDTRIWKK